MIAAIERSILQLDSLPLDCENLIRVIATLLDRDGVPYKAHQGAMWVKGIGHVEPHCWLVLDGGRTVDFRARLWLGEEERVPHGIFVPTDSQVYTSYKTFNAVVHPVVVFALTGSRLEHFPTLGSTGTVRHSSKSLKQITSYA